MNLVDRTTRLSRLVLEICAIGALTLGIPSIGGATNISLVGSWSYTQTGTTIVLKADKIQNKSLATRSGTLRMELWAFRSPFNGSQSGYTLATYTLPEVLTAGYEY